MSHPVLQRCVAWLCLALAIVTGSSPARGLVICIEADGCVRVEMKAASAPCAGCDAHAELAQPAAPAAPDLDDCACIDVVVPGASAAPRPTPLPIDVEHGARIELRVAIASGPPRERVARIARTSRAVDRPPQTLALIRSVVLLV